MTRFALSLAASDTFYGLLSPARARVHPPLRVHPLYRAPKPKSSSGLQLLRLLHGEDNRLGSDPSVLNVTRSVPQRLQQPCERRALTAFTGTRRFGVHRLAQPVLTQLGQRPAQGRIKGRAAVGGDSHRVAT